MFEMKLGSLHKDSWSQEPVVAVNGSNATLKQSFKARTSVIHLVVPNAGSNRVLICCTQPMYTTKGCQAEGLSAALPHRKGGGGLRVYKNMNLQILARQDLCYSLKMSEPYIQIMYGSPKVLVRNSGCLKSEGAAEGGCPPPKTQNTPLKTMIRRKAALCGPAQGACRHQCALQHCSPSWICTDTR